MQKGEPCTPPRSQTSVYNRNKKALNVRLISYIKKCGGDQPNTVYVSVQDVSYNTIQKFISADSIWT